MCRALTTVTPSGTISCACWAAEPCGTPSSRVALPDTAAASGTVASTSTWPARERLLEVGEVLRLGAERHGQEHDRPARGGLRVLQALDLGVGHLLAHAPRGLLGAAGVARADGHRAAGGREAQRQAEAQRAGAADDRDGVRSAHRRRHYRRRLRGGIGSGLHEAQGKIALVTGATGGIGAATCERLAGEGARVAVADLDLDRARELAGGLDGVGVELDVRSIDSVAAAVAAAEAELGPVDVLVNNAGVAEDDFFTRTDPDMWDRVIAVNLRGVLAVTHAVLPGMHERGGGSIVNIASEAGRVGSQLSTVYSATKAGRDRLHQGAGQGVGALRGARERRGSRPDRDADAARRPRALGELGERFVQGMVASTAMRRPGRPEEVAATIAYLAGDDASFVTGETIGVSGGLGMM